MTPSVPHSASAVNAALALALTAPGRRQSPISVAQPTDLVEPVAQADELGLVLGRDLAIENMQDEIRDPAFGQCDHQ